MENLKYLQLNHLMLQHWALLIIQCLVLLIISKLENNLVLRNMHDFWYLREMLIAYPAISCLALMKAVLIATHLEIMIDTMKEPSINL